MQLQKTGSKRYAFLPSGILIVEPDPKLLAARELLLTAADYYVAASNAEVAGTRLQEIGVRVAVLSQSLGEPTLTTLAQEIRLYWPNVRTLIFGQHRLTLVDQLYDGSVDLHCLPEELLDAWFCLARSPRDPPVLQRARIGTGPLSLSGFSWISLHRIAAESDPTKESMATSSSKPTVERDVPADETSNR